MGVLGGDEWDTPQLPEGTVMINLQTPTVSPAAGAGANSNFRTGLATQVSSNLVLAIHAIRWNFFIQRRVDYEDVSDFYVGIVSEDVGATIAANELTDPRTLAEAGLGRQTILATAVGGADSIYNVFSSAEFDPPIYTIAQQLNILAEIVENGTATSPSCDIHVKIAYTVEPVSQGLINQLQQRLNLATQP